MAKPIPTKPSKYAWHPQHRPASADPFIAMRVARMSPLTQCLETALDELLAEDRRHDDDDDNIIIDAAGNDTISFDDALSKSILDSYCKSVVETKFDDETTNNTDTSMMCATTAQPSKKSATTSTTTSTSSTTAAPAAMLMGEIDHYNRVGGQWRIVVKNACMKRRSMTQVDNGKIGRSLRKNMVLDWNDVDDNKKHTIDNEGDIIGHEQISSPDSYKFSGTIQILAYDDDT